MTDDKQRDLRYVGSSKKDLKKLPAIVKESFTFGLLLAQSGDRHPDAKTLSGMGSAKVIEVRNRYEKNAYRAV